MQTISWVLRIKNQPNSFRASAALTLNAFDAAMVDFRISVTDSRNHGAWSYADDGIASQDVRLCYVLCRVRGQYGWRLALAGDNAHNQIAAPTLNAGVRLLPPTWDALGTRLERAWNAHGVRSDFGNAWEIRRTECIPCNPKAGQQGTPANHALIYFSVSCPGWGTRIRT